MAFRIDGVVSTDKPIRWHELKPELQLVFAKKIADAMGPDIDPIVEWNARSPADQRHWIWQEENPTEAKGEYAAEVARINAAADGRHTAGVRQAAP